MGPSTPNPKRCFDVGSRGTKLDTRDYPRDRFTCLLFALGDNVALSFQTLVRLLRPFKAINLPVNTRILDYINYNYTYRRTRAATDLDYKPLFTYEEAVHNSKRYYKNMPV